MEECMREMCRGITGIAGWIEVLQQRVPSSMIAVSKACFQGTLKLHNLDSLTCYIHNHIVLDFTLPGTEHMLTIVFICCVLQKEE
jgi:hypothetical protein